MSTPPEPMELKTIRYEVADGIATITFNRPERMNAWTGRMHHEYRWGLASAEADPNVGAVIVTGEGRAFCVGADAKALEGHVQKGGYDPGVPAEMPNPGYDAGEAFQANFAFQFGLNKPIIAAINGPAAGVGLVIACYADIRFAVPGVKLTTAHGKLNLPAEYGLSWLLPKLIGQVHANDVLLTSRQFLTDEAMQLGLLNGLVDADQLMTHTREWTANLLATVSPDSLAATKRQIYMDWHRDVGASVEDSEIRLRDLMKRPNYKEAVKAFFEKRLPNWSRD